MQGGQQITASAPYEQMPIFVREGSIIPTGPEIHIPQKRIQTLLLYHVYGGKDASFTLYEDEGTNYNYEKGAFAEIALT